MTARLLQKTAGPYTLSALHKVILLWTETEDLKDTLLWNVDCPSTSNELLKVTLLLTKSLPPTYKLLHKLSFPAILRSLQRDTASVTNKLLLNTIEPLNTEGL